MTKNKKVGVISLASLAVLAAGIVIGLSAQKSGLRAQVTADAPSTATAPVDSLAPTSSASASNSIPLNQPPVAEPAPSGLQARSSSAANGNLGQSTASSQSSGTGQSANGGSSNGAAASNPFDPATFKQYDKYLNDKSPLFGDPQVGDGATLEAGKKAVVYYRGWLTNGTLFDQSRADSTGKMQPFSFTVGSHQVISGWEQGLLGMKVNGVRLLIVPPSVGYGASGQGSIPPNSLLVFQVQLVAVE